MQVNFLSILLTMFYFYYKNNHNNKYDQAKMTFQNIFECVFSIVINGFQHQQKMDQRL